MREFLLVTALLAVTALGPSAPAIAQENTDQKLGTVHFATSCNETAQRRFDRAMRYQHSFWYAESKEIYRGRAQSRPGMRHCLLGHRAVASQQPAQCDTGAQSSARACGDREGESSRRQDRTGARLHRRAGGHVCRLRQDPATRARAVLSEEDGSAGGKISGRRRSADLLRDHPECSGVARRQDLRQPAQGGRHPRADLAAATSAPRHRPLSDPSV